MGKPADKSCDSSNQTTAIERSSHWSTWSATDTDRKVTDKLLPHETRDQHVQRGTSAAWLFPSEATRGNRGPDFVGTTYSVKCTYSNSYNHKMTSWSSQQQWSPPKPEWALCMHQYHLYWLSAGPTDGATGHGGQDPQGGRGPSFTNERVCLSLIILQLHFPSLLTTSPKLIPRAGQVGHIVWGGKNINKKKNIAIAGKETKSNMKIFLTRIFMIWHFGGWSIVLWWYTFFD